MATQKIDTRLRQPPENNNRRRSVNPMTATDYYQRASYPRQHATPEATTATGAFAQYGGGITAPTYVALNKALDALTQEVFRDMDREAGHWAADAQFAARLTRFPGAQGATPDHHVFEILAGRVNQLQAGKPIAAFLASLDDKGGVELRQIETFAGVPLTNARITAMMQTAPLGVFGTRSAICDAASQHVPARPQPAASALPGTPAP